MKTMKRVEDQLQKIVGKYPLLGPILWILGLQYMVVQLVVAAAWPWPYSWSNNYISDLGNTECGLYDGLYVCSPLHEVMNLSFIIFGISIALGAVLIYEQFIRTRLSLAAFIMMVMSGIGTIIVGIFPENNPNGLHIVGAFLALGIGNVSVVLLGITLRGLHPLFRLYTVTSGIFSIVAFGLFIAGIYLGFGRGGMERLVSYPFTIWMISFGIYMTYVRVRARLS